jgi:hypothetical protein
MWLLSQVRKIMFRQFRNLKRISVKNIGSAQVDPSCEASNLRGIEEDLEQEMVGLPSKRIRRQPLKRNKDFLW